MGFLGFGGIEDFLTTRITREHKDGHVFLVFVVCVCFVVEQGSERRREEGVSVGGVSERALLKKLCVSAALREVFFPLTVAGA
jgi:hypothetical protein